MIRLILCILLINIFSFPSYTQSIQPDSPGDGWAANSINVAIFRKNSLVSFKDTQFIAYYDPEGFMVIGKRAHDSQKWEIHQTKYSGNTTDAHNGISIMVDGDGFLHIAWDHHNSPLRYIRSLYPGSLMTTAPLVMTGSAEQKVTYPEFYKLRNGDLLFFYRDGSSGNGNLVLKRFDLKEKKWFNIHEDLISGEGKRNAYWQAYADKHDRIHLSWVWRESSDVYTNHDICYAYSENGGQTWKRSDRQIYSLPITMKSAEIVRKIPEGSELINTTSMSADDQGNPFIATYWRAKNSSIPQYHIIYYSGRKWSTIQLDFRKTTFSLSGSGTKSIPISRPQLIVTKTADKTGAVLLFRDEERANRASVCIISDITRKRWKIRDISTDDLGSWEPTLDTELWKDKQILHLFVQKVMQEDREGVSAFRRSPIRVLPVDIF